MSLALPALARFQAETPSVMCQAAQTRLLEATALVEAGQWDGAVYLAGYVAEMLLKVAYCDLEPSFPANGTVDAVFGPARTLWQSLVPGRDASFSVQTQLAVLGTGDWAAPQRLWYQADGVGRNLAFLPVSHSDPSALASRFAVSGPSCDAGRSAGGLQCRTLAV